MCVCVFVCVCECVCVSVCVNVCVFVCVCECVCLCVCVSIVLMFNNRAKTCQNSACKNPYAYNQIISCNIFQFSLQ